MAPHVSRSLDRVITLGHTWRRRNTPAIRALCLYEHFAKSMSLTHTHTLTMQNTIDLYQENTRLLQPPLLPHSPPA